MTGVGAVRGHHLWFSLGCATENLAQAALAAGWHADVHCDTGGPGAITVNLEATRARITPWAQAIAPRQCNRGDCEGTPCRAPASAELRSLALAGTGHGVQVLLLTERATMWRVLAHVVKANTVQMSDDAFMSELKAWMRFGRGPGMPLSLRRPVRAVWV